MLASLSGRPLTSEYARKPREARFGDDANGELDFGEESVENIREDLWYIFAGKLKGAGPGGELRVILDGGGVALETIQHVCSYRSCALSWNDLRRKSRGSQDGERRAFAV